jgi:hypothetical protein
LLFLYCFAFEVTGTCSLYGIYQNLLPRIFRANAGEACAASVQLSSKVLNIFLELHLIRQAGILSSRLNYPPYFNIFETLLVPMCQGRLIVGHPSLLASLPVGRSKCNRQPSVTPRFTQYLQIAPAPHQKLCTFAMIKLQFLNTNSLNYFKFKCTCFRYSSNTKSALF